MFGVKTLTDNLHLVKLSIYDTYLDRKKTEVRGQTSVQ